VGVAFVGRGGGGRWQNPPLPQDSGDYRGDSIGGSDITLPEAEETYNDAKRIMAAPLGLPLEV
jgi:hypothetical protein